MFHSTTLRRWTSTMTLTDDSLAHAGTLGVVAAGLMAILVFIL